MIFVTVGTDEHPFTRLLNEIERLVKRKFIEEEVIIQCGHTPFSSEVIKDIFPMLPFDRFLDYIKQARIVVTHGGPGSIMLALSCGKIPIVVPRRKNLGEHIDDHQLIFTEFLKGKGRIIAVYDIDKLGETILDYEKRMQKLGEIRIKNPFERAGMFAEKLEEIIKEL